jgi:hypothetical protein
MSHPLMYVFGDTEKKDFPLILTIGREPNYDDVLGSYIGRMNIQEFNAMSGGVWVTAYTQFAKQFIGSTGTSRYMKNLCIDKNSSPIVFTNAYPCGIINAVNDKQSVRLSLKDLLPAHIELVFSQNLIKRVKLVVQHGADNSESSQIASELIQSKCNINNIPYCSTPFFYNGNSMAIQESLAKHNAIIKSIFTEFDSHE